MSRVSEERSRREEARTTRRAIVQKLLTSPALRKVLVDHMRARDQQLLKGKKKKNKDGSALRGASLASADTMSTTTTATTATTRAVSYTHLTLPTILLV